MGYWMNSSTSEINLEKEWFINSKIARNPLVWNVKTRYLITAKSVSLVNWFCDFVYRPSGWDKTGSPGPSMESPFNMDSEKVFHGWKCNSDNMLGGGKYWTFLKDTYALLVFQKKKEKDITNIVFRTSEFAVLWHDSAVVSVLCFLFSCRYLWLQ